MWKNGEQYDYFSQNHRPEGVLALSAGLLMLSSVMAYRVAKAICGVRR